MTAPLPELDDARRRALLHAARRLEPAADDAPAPLRVFLPLPMHEDALDPRTFIVRGGRGTGKTALFRALRRLSSEAGGVSAMFPGVARWPAAWVEGYAELGRDHPSPEVLGGFGRDADDRALHLLWFGHLVGRLATAPDVPLAPPPGPFLPAWRDAVQRVERWVPLVDRHLGELGAWLDALDRHLADAGHAMVVTYDHLDRLAPHDTTARRRFTATLLAMWLSLTHRHAAIRAKVFVREDLFRASLDHAPDSSKLRARSTELRWSTEDLYRVLLRHLGDDDGLRAWLQAGGLPFRPFGEDGRFGHAPPDALPEDGPVSQRRLATLLAGEIMGAGVKKGYTHRWIPNHLADAHGAIVPRSILNLVAFAARHALHRGPRGRGPSLLHPQELQAALEETSRHRVDELAEEYPVVRRLEGLRGLVLLATRREVEERLAPPPTDVPAGDGFGTDGERVFRELEGLGILRVRRDGRVDIPDIYRFGFGIRRKGGVARPR